MNLAAGAPLYVSLAALVCCLGATSDCAGAIIAQSSLFASIQARKIINFAPRALLAPSPSLFPSPCVGCVSGMHLNCAAASSSSFVLNGTKLNC